MNQYNQQPVQEAKEMALCNLKISNDIQENSNKAQVATLNNEQNQ